MAEPSTLDGDGQNAGSDSLVPPETEYSFGKPAKDVYSDLSEDRDQMLYRARELANLTIPAVLPPDSYVTGEKLDGLNQAANAFLVNNLAGKLLFIMWPPGMPCFAVEAIEYVVQQEVDQNPELWANLQLAFAALERAHRKRFSTTTLQTACLGALKLALIAGNWGWRHLRLDRPTFHQPNHYVCERDGAGQLLRMVLHERIAWWSLPPDAQEVVRRHWASSKMSEELTWETKVDIYSCIRLCGWHGDDPHWKYWEEFEGVVLPGTAVENDFEAPCMTAEWLIPVFGQNWGWGYCEEYRGDLFSMEALESALLDGASLASLALIFGKPGAATPRSQFEKAQNLSTLDGSAEDYTVFRADKTGDFNFVAAQAERVERRLARAFLSQTAIQRTGERVTAEEIKRLGNELNQAMGGTYTSLGQGWQRRMLLRSMKLNEAENPDLPGLPKGVVQIQVMTGPDAMGRSSDEQALVELGAEVNQTFGPQAANTALNAPNWTARLAAAKGIKPDGLVVTQQQMDQKMQQAQQDAAKQEMLKGAVGPVAGALAKHAAPLALPAPQQGGPGPQQQQGG